VQLSERFWIWIGYRSPQFLTLGYGLDMDFMKKFRIESGLQNFHIHTPLYLTTIDMAEWEVTRQSSVRVTPLLYLVFLLMRLHKIVSQNFWTP